MKWSKEFLEALIVRALRTGAQTAVSMITVGAAFLDINWGSIIGVSVVAMIASALTSIATDLPESGFDGTVPIETIDPERSTYKTGDVIRLKITESEDK